MLSTLKNDIRFDEKGILQVVPMEYPNWYGIEGIGFIYYNRWEDPDLEYKGKIINSYYIEEHMWTRFQYDDEWKDKSDSEFDKYMLQNADIVKEYLDELIPLL